MFGKALKNVSSAVKRAAQSAPKPAPAPAPMPSPSFPKMGNPFRKISRRPSGPAGFKEGGMPMVMKDGKKIPAFAADGEGKMKRGGSVKKMAGGGLAAGHKQADGIARKGKTDTKRVVMKSGGAVKKMRSGGKTC